MARLRNYNLILLFITAMENVNVSSAAMGSYQNTRLIREPRQLGAGPLQTGLSTTTSSFDYWWPYPAWTATASSATAWTSPTLSSPVFSVPMATQGGIEMPFSTSGALLDTADLISSTSDAFTSSSSSASSTLSSSSLPTSTAVPQSRSSNFRNIISNPHVFIPLIASVLGAIVLAILLWIICKRYGSRRRRSQTRNTNRLSYYYPSEGQGWRAVRLEKRSRWGRLFGTHEEFEDVIPGPRYVGVDDPDTMEAEKVDVERLDFRGVDEERDVTWGIEDYFNQDRFALSKPKRARTRRSDRSRPKSSRRSSKTSSTAATRPLLPSPSLPRKSFVFGMDDDGGSDEAGEDDDDYDDEFAKTQLQIPWESLRHKSIKRAILAKVDEEKRWTDSMRGLRASKAVEKRTSDRRGRPSRSTRTNRSQRQREEEEGEVGRGFRIVIESPPPQIPTPRSAGSGSGKASWSLASSFPFPLFSTGNEETSRREDPYTPVPMRMRSGSRSCGSSRAGSPMTSPTKSSPTKKSASRSRRQSQMHVAPSPSVLRIRSPQSVMTPQLESVLCFTPVMESTARMDGNRMRGDGEEPELGTVYTKTYRDRTDRAMRRVEAIVESGWNERGRVRDEW